eukprot:g255.t1
MVGKGRKKQIWIELITIIACIVDAADKALLPATFKSLQITLSVGPAALGMLTFFQSVSYSLALPLWGALVSYGYHSTDLLAFGCIGFGFWTCLLSLSSNFLFHCIVRCLNGAFLCGILPIGQAIIVQAVPPQERGRVFGRLSASMSLASLMTFTFFTSSTTWRSSYQLVGILSILVGFFVFQCMPKSKGKRTVKNNCYATTKLITSIPSFGLLVLQGVTGGIPWNAMSFLPLYWITLGFSDTHAGILSATIEAGSILGNLIGGYLGDAWAKKSKVGRVYTAQLSVFLGIPTFIAIFYIIPQDANHFYTTCILSFVFGSLATWTSAAANRPICAELVSTPEQQAQIVALWVMLEGVSSSIFGSPLVGFLSETFAGTTLNLETHSETSSQDMAKALVSVSTSAWTICLLTWIAMMYTLPTDKENAEKRKKDKNIEEERQGLVLASGENLSVQQDQL